MDCGCNSLFGGAITRWRLTPMIVAGSTNAAATIAILPFGRNITTMQARASAARMKDVSALVLDEPAKHCAGYAAAADRHQDGESGSDNIS